MQAWCLHARQTWSCWTEPKLFPEVQSVFKEVKKYFTDINGGKEASRRGREIYLGNHRFIVLSHMVKSSARVPKDIVLY